MHRTLFTRYMLVFAALLVLAVWGISRLPSQGAQAQTVPPTPTPLPAPLPTPLPGQSFVPIAPPGFGDRQNSWAWAMTWWNGYLYVGTNRAWGCMEAASVARISPIFGKYPPDDPDIACTPEPEDLSTQAEIWRWSPQTNFWERVYQSPKDVPVTAGRLVARDVGFRGLSVFREPDGTEALYVGGVSPRFVWPETIPPRLLRSTDGVNFEPVPQDPGTVLGDLTYASLRNQLEFKGRFFILGGPVQGSGELLEAVDPSGGNDNFQVVSPPNVQVSAVEVYNDYLYLGVRDILNGYGVIRTKATGPLPYTYETVVEYGAYLPDLPSIEVLGMQVFRDRLYVGTNGVLLAPLLMGPAELLRINPDNSWDLVVGDGRETPKGWIYPLSGFTAGFGNFYNAHVWRMASFEDQLYVGTFDAATVFRNANKPIRPIKQDLLGFDLLRSVNGRDYIPVTRTGFDDKFNFGVRSLETSPVGLFLGSANYYYGLQIWMLPPGNLVPSRIHAFMPLVAGGIKEIPGLAISSPPAAPHEPDQAEAMVRGADVVLAWDAVLGASSYQVWRAAPRTTIVEGYTVQAGWDEASVVAEVAEPYWVDLDGAAQNYLYYVTAVGANGAVSGPSNLAPVRAETIDDLALQLAGMNWSELGLDRWHLVESELGFGSSPMLAPGSAPVVGGAALPSVSQLRRLVRQPSQDLLPDWQAEDADYVLRQLERRLALVQSGILQP